MSQVLVLDVTYGGEDIAAIYYRWSAYTLSSLAEIARLRYAFDKTDFTNVTPRQAQLMLIRALEDKNPFRKAIGCQVHGGVDPDDLAYARARYPGETFATDVDNCCGLVAISPRDRAEVRECAEGRASIDLKDRTFSTGVWMEATSDGFDDWFTDEELEAARKYVGPDLERTFTWDELDGLGRALSDLPELYVTSTGRLIGQID